MTKAPLSSDGLLDKFSLLITYPCCYEKDGTPSEMTDYISLVYVRSDHYHPTDVLDKLRSYGATSARWLTDFWSVDNGR